MVRDKVKICSGQYLIVYCMLSLRVMVPMGVFVTLTQCGERSPLDPTVLGSTPARPDRTQTVSC